MITYIDNLLNCKGCINLNKNLINKFKQNFDINIDDLIAEYEDLLNNLENQFESLKSCEDCLNDIIDLANYSSTTYTKNLSNKNAFQKTTNKLKTTNVAVKRYPTYSSTFSKNQIQKTSKKIPTNTNNNQALNKPKFKLPFSHKTKDIKDFRVNY